MPRKETVLMVLEKGEIENGEACYWPTEFTNGTLVEARKWVSEHGANSGEYLCVRVVDRFTVQHEVIKKVTLIVSDNSPDVGKE